MNRAVAKPLVAAVTIFILLLTLLIWLICRIEFDQINRFGDGLKSLPPFGYVLHGLYHWSWLLPLSAGILGGRILKNDETSLSTLARYCCYFFVTAITWAFIAIMGFYSIYAMSHVLL